MLVTIQQTKSNIENLFEVSSNGQLLFQAKAPWMKISLPFNAEDLRELTFSNPAGEIVYTTRYKFIDNLVEESIPFKYLLTKGQRFGQFEIIGRNGSEGAFYVMQNGLFDSKFCIECSGKVYLGYRTSMRQSFQSSPSSPFIMTIGNTITVGSLPRTRFRYPTAIPMVRTTTNITQTGLPRSSASRLRTNWNRN